MNNTYAIAAVGEGRKPQLFLLDRIFDLESVPCHDTPPAELSPDVLDHLWGIDGTDGPHHVRVHFLNEAGVFAQILKKNGIEYYAVGCKIGAIEKSEIGIPPENTLTKGEQYESMCNPIMQAKILNEKKTDLNVMIGLCVGHDSLFLKYAEAPTTVLVVKDRVTGHNPCVPLWTYNGIYSKI